jgi:hypothetical protein
MTERSRADRALWIAVAVLVGLLFSFMAWQYVMPLELRSTFNLNHPGVEQFRRQFRIAAAPLALDRYTLGFRAFIGAIWLAYFVVLAACFEGGRLTRRATFLVVAGSALAIAVVWPLSFSGDVYSYVGYARLATDHHANPYFADRTILRAVNDPTAAFMAPLLSSPYGPLWNLLSIALVWSTRALGLFAQLLAFKLVAAAALVALAWTVRALAEPGEPRRGDAAVLAVGLNPLLLIEGPGNGHNDVLMMALVLGGVLALSRKRPGVGALLVGAAAAIKYLPLALVPWVAVAAAVAEASPRRRVVAVLAVGALALAPLVLAFAPFWRGLATLGGLAQRWSEGQVVIAGQARVVSTMSVVAVAVYVVTSAWVMARPAVGRIAAGWTCLAITLFFTATGMLYPWYLAWSWPAIFVRWRTPTRVAAVLLTVASLLWMLAYSIAGRDDHGQSAPRARISPAGRSTLL